METITPLKEDLKGQIPPYNKLEFSHRAIWTGNRCLTILYRIVRNFYSAVWFYYIPFVALTVNFSMPFLQERFGEEVLEAGAMSAEYE